MRKSCLKCVTKHLGKALINLSEVHLGYPEFMLLVIGNLSEAEDESILSYPQLANEIRDHRKHLINDSQYEIPFFNLYKKVLELQEKEKVTESYHLLNESKNGA